MEFLSNNKPRDLFRVAWIDRSGNRGIWTVSTYYIPCAVPDLFSVFLRGQINVSALILESGEFRIVMDFCCASATVVAKDSVSIIAVTINLPERELEFIVH